MIAFRPAYALCAVVWTIAVAASADYVEVRRDATIKVQPTADAEIVTRPPVGTHLVLAEPGQTDGYYHVFVPSAMDADASDGYVYRTLVRGFTGDPPEVDVADDGPATTDIVYKGTPINEFTEFPITILNKDFFVVGYSEDFKNPAWVFYRIGPATDFRSFPRPGFRTDGDTESRVSSQEYVNSGFDRGHMAPNFALGSRFGQTGAKSTFVMSNVAPQFHSFNDGQWGDLEEWIAGRKPPNATATNFIRGWADHLGEVWVVVGPLFEEDRDPMDSDIPVPSSFFCIVVDELAGGRPRALAFIMPHEDERVDELTAFLVSVDEVERRAGLDFFPNLSNSVEDEMEATVATGLWPLPQSPN